MWRHPEWLLEPAANQAWQFFGRFKLTGSACPQFESNVIANDTIDGQAIRLLINGLTSLYRAARAFQMKLNDSKAPPFFVQAYEVVIKEICQHITATGQYSLVSRIWHWHEAIVIYSENMGWAGISADIALNVHCLLGDESRELVGTRLNVPTWKQFKQPIRNRDEALRYKKKIGLDNQLQYIHPDDVELVPYADERAAGLWVWDHLWPQVATRAQIREILERAFYNQRYTLSPEGAHVSLAGFSRIRAMTLKVRTGISDPNYIDFVARFDLDRGSYVEVLNGEVGTEQREQIQYEEQQGRFDLFFYYLMAQVYHDLVTAVEIPYQAPSGDKKSVGRKIVTSTLPSPPDTDPRPIPIPRFAYIGHREPREPMAEPRIMKPHRVTGYFRDGTPSETHLQHLREFEEEYGVKIFPLPEGQNYWRPHVSPRTEPEEFRRLPRFIRFRLQEEIDQRRQEAIEASRAHLAPP